MQFINIDIISHLQKDLSELTGLSLSVYGEKGNIILPPVAEDKFLSAVRSSSVGGDEYDDFLIKHTGDAVRRKNVSIVRGPTGQQYFFIPVRAEGSVFIITGSGIYLSAKDFEDFCKSKGQSYGFLPHQFKSWSQEIIVRDYADIQNTARHIQSLFNLLIGENSEGSLNEKRYRLMKTIFSLISDIKLDKQADEIHDILLDVLTFLFNADSVSIMIRDDNVFRPRRVAGRLKEHLQSLSLKVTGMISEVVEKKKPLYFEDVMEILRLGVGEEVTSVYVFPVMLEDEVTGLLCIFNTNIPQEDADILSELCRITGFIFRLLELQGIYGKRIKDADVLKMAAERLNPVKEPDMLYETIVDTSVHLADAEKGSLMLAGEDAYLTVKAAKGINKKLLSEIKIRAGEGIAGKVYREGVSLIVDDIEKNERLLIRRRPKYKTGSFISIPLKIGEKTIGVLNISDKITGEVFSDEDMALLHSFASYASIALERSMYYNLAGHLKELSITDFQTDLFNRRYFEERLFEEFQRSNRYNLSFSLAMIDIDDFKLFNDSEGHLAGDEVLKSIANIAKDSLRVIDVIARFGGEEFAVVMPQTEKDEAYIVAERIRNSVKEQLPCTWKTFPRHSITISTGIATFPNDGKDRKELIRNADKALYRAKMEGKDKTVVCEDKRQ